MYVSPPFVKDQHKARSFLENTCLLCYNEWGAAGLLSFARICMCHQHSSPKTEFRCCSFWAAKHHRAMHAVEHAVPTRLKVCVPYGLPCRCQYLNPPTRKTPSCMYVQTSRRGLEKQSVYIRRRHHAVRFSPIHCLIYFEARRNFSRTLVNERTTKQPRLNTGGGGRGGHPLLGHRNPS